MHRKRNIIIGFSILILALLPIILGVTYLAWFAKQGIAAGKQANAFYTAILNKDDISRYLCEDGDEVRDYLRKQELTFGKVKEIRGSFNLSKRKRGERFPEKKFIVMSMTVVRGDSEFQPRVELHKENGKFKVCGLEE